MDRTTVQNFFEKWGVFILLVFISVMLTRMSETLTVIESNQGATADQIYRMNRTLEDLTNEVDLMEDDVDDFEGYLDEINNTLQY